MFCRFSPLLHLVGVKENMATYLTVLVVCVQQNADLLDCDRKRCPACKRWVEKTEGCNHIL